MTTTYKDPSDWDRPAVTPRPGFTDSSVVVERAGDQPFPVGVPSGMTPRAYAEILHGFDGYTVRGFGYGPDVEHPGDCAFCNSGEGEKHNYESMNVSEAGK